VLILYECSPDGSYVAFINKNPIKEETRNVKFSIYFNINHNVSAFQLATVNTLAITWTG
jgi:hypothetical protein